MLQFNATVYTITNRFTSRFLWRLNASLITNVASKTSEVNTNVKLDQLKGEISNTNERIPVFNELKTKLCNHLNVDSSVTSKIQSAQDIYDLLEVIKTPVLPQSEILKALETITLWVSKNNKDTSSTESSTTDKSSKQKEKEDEIQNKVIATDVEDILQYADLSTQGMIQKIYNLAQAGNRNVHLLNFLFQNIIKYNERLNTGACSSLMYSMSNLSYSDERLLKKICTDLINIQNTNPDKITTSTLVSIIKSMALIRYRNDIFLNHVFDNIISTSKYNFKHIANLLLSCALLGFYSESVNKVIELYMPHLTLSALGSISWLNFVWSLTVFKRVKSSDIECVLDNGFITNLLKFDSKRQIPIKLKLLNINGYAKYALKDYSGPFVDNKIIPPIVPQRTKQKELYVDALEITLKNMLPSSSYYRMNTNSEMGFLLDAEIHIDSDLKLIEVNSIENTKCTKIAILIIDYCDMCLGGLNYHGLIHLYNHLLNSNNYKVLCIPYNNFGIEDKVEKRITYLRNQLWKMFKKPF